MKHVVLLTSGIPGVLNPNLEFGRRLVRAGLRVTYASPAHIEESVDAYGIAFVHVGADRSDSRVGSRSRVDRILRAPRLRARRLDAVNALGLERSIATLEALSPDLILIDLELHEYLIAAHGRGLPVAVVSVWLAMWKRPGLAPLHHYVLPAPGLKGRLAVAWAWMRYRLWKFGRLRLDWLRRVGADRVSVLRALARQTGFPFRAEVDFWQWPLPFAYRRLPLVLLNARELDLPHDPPPHVRYVGPMIPDPGPGHPTDPVEKALTDRGATARPLVYVAFGSFFTGDDTTFIHRVLEAVAARSDWDVIVALGSRLKSRSFGRLPDHVQVFDWAPQARVISMASAAVIHGGIGTINECLWFGVPMVAYPFDTNDQMGTAVRIAHHRVGIVGDRETDTATEIRARIVRVLTDPGFRDRAESLGERLKAYDRDDAGVTAVRALMSSSASRGSSAT